MKDLKKIAEEIIQAAIESVKPDWLIQQKISKEGDLLLIGGKRFDLRKFRNIYIVGAGKASALMASEMERKLGGRLSGGVVTVKYGHAAPCHKVRILEAGHPVIDQNSLAATEEILKIAQTAGNDSLVFCLLSGGGSALLEKLPDGVSLRGLQKTFELLLGCGATIEEINAVRRHLSLVKGGQLARAISPAACVSIILSDVIGDPLESIASGPTAPDSTTFADAWETITKYKLGGRLPRTIARYLEDGRNGRAPETLKADDPIFDRVSNIILGNNMAALDSARAAAEKHGFHPVILSSRIQGEAREVAKVVAAMVREIQSSDRPVPRPACLLMGGETTVTLRGNGKGGRNQELALAALIAMKSVREDYLIASCGTDGTDGPTDAAGGMAFPAQWKIVESRGIDPQFFLENNDAYPFLRQAGGLIITGPTGTNVMDIMLAVVP